jgi:hypothetical protein
VSCLASVRERQAAGDDQLKFGAQSLSCARATRAVLIEGAGKLEGRTNIVPSV